ncbi:MAG: hypothetical protein MJ252_06755 [archaeon]|nr:hypothetical protein [archaeon]
MSLVASTCHKEIEEEINKVAAEDNLQQLNMLGQQVNLSLLQSLSLPVTQVDLKEKKIFLTFSTAQDFSQIKTNLLEFFKKNLNEEVRITPTPKDTEIIIEFSNDSISNYLYNSLKNEMELNSLVDANETFDDGEPMEETKEEPAKAAKEKPDLSQLMEIIQKKEYKEYQPIKKRMNYYQTVQFNTRSLRDYQKKFVAQYFVQIENDSEFQVTKILIGNNGVLLRKIIVDNCINFNDYSTKIRLRGRGSGYKEGPRNVESNDPLELCVSSLNYNSFIRCCFHIENILRSIYYQYYVYQCKVNFMKKNPERPILKKIMKYQYVVNRTVSESKN